MPAETRAYVTDRKEQFTRLEPGGKVSIYYRIWATSKGGTYFSIEIPEGRLNEADKHLTEKAVLLDKI